MNVDKSLAPELALLGSGFFRLAPARPRAGMGILRPFRVQMEGGPKLLAALRELKA